MSQSTYHHGLVIRSFRQQRGWSTQELVLRLYFIGDALRLERTVDTAFTLASHLSSYGDETDSAFHSRSGILAEKSYGYLELNEPRKTLAMRDEIVRQIHLDQHTRLHSWIYLDWARAYLMLNEVEASAQAAREFFHRATALHSPHALRRAYHHLHTLEQGGYTTVRDVRELRELLFDPCSGSPSEHDLE